MNFKSIKNYVEKNYKFLVIISLFLFLIMTEQEKFTPRGGHKVKDQEDQEDFSTTQALDAVASTETKVNNMAKKVGDNYVDLKSGIRLSGKWMNGATATNSEIANDTGTYKKLMIIGNKSAGSVRKVGIWDHLDVHGNQSNSGYIKSMDRLCIGGTCINENDMQKMKASRMIGGFVINGHGSTFPLQEGGIYNLGDWKKDNQKYNAWSNDNWDIAYLYRGWRAEFWEHYKGHTGKGGIGTLWKYENKTEDVKKCDMPNDTVSSFRMTWIGY
jgi:hypothetical protein